MKKQIKKNLTLISRKDISSVFKDGKVFLNYPFRFIWTERNEKHSIKVLISIPKKNFKKAVERNLIKRQLKEILHKKVINTYLEEKSINLVITYIGDQKIDFNDLENKMMITFRKFILKHFSDEKKTN
tara:strand:- start:354 stop:737 length:384 start_codon:yes stop_codon:yes gene_type:complete